MRLNLKFIIKNIISHFSFNLPSLSLIVGYHSRERIDNLNN